MPFHATDPAVPMPSQAALPALLNMLSMPLPMPLATSMPVYDFKESVISLLYWFTFCIPQYAAPSMSSMNSRGSLLGGWKGLPVSVCLFVFGANFLSRYLLNSAPMSEPILSAEGPTAFQLYLL